MRPTFNKLLLPERKPSSIVYDALTQDEAVNKLQFPNDPTIYEFNLSDLDLLNNGIIASDKCIVKKYLHRPSKQIMAVKFVHIPFCYNDPQKEYELQKLIREIKLHQKLNYSKNIVNLYGFCINEGDALICMLLMDMSLKDFYLDVHKNYGYFPESLMGVIVVSVIHAFQHLNKNGIIHRDIKPSNILLNLNSEIKLCDFGESRLLENNQATSIVGTVAYWAPERIYNRQNPYDCKRTFGAWG